MADGHHWLRVELFLGAMNNMSILLNIHSSNIEIGSNYWWMLNFSSQLPHRSKTATNQ